MTKLIIQIPCLNEERALPVTLAALPREIPGIDRVEVLVVNDGSTDRTVEVARAHGADHVVSHPWCKGLAAAFTTGLDEALRRGADIVVNTDADNQYEASDIPRLIAPILEGKADYVIGCRPIRTIAHFSRVKKWLQAVGSWVVRAASGVDVPDAPSGFRALSREAALRLHVFGSYTYTLESLIQAGRNDIRTTAIQVRVNPELRPSRLVRSIPLYVWRSAITILRIFLLYKAFRVFVLTGIVIALPGVLLGFRYLWLMSIGQGAGHVQSVIFTTLLISLGAIVAVGGVLADLVAVNRRLLEDIQLRLRRRELERVQDSKAKALLEDTHAEFPRKGSWS